MVANAMTQVEPSDGPPSLVVDHVSRSFGTTCAIRDVTFHVAAGEVVGLLGHNGAGKTTLLRMVAGILRPDAGSIRVCGADMATNPLGAKRRLGFLSSDTRLFERLTPVEVLRYFGALFELPADYVRERTASLVAEFDLTAFKDKPCGALSQGQKQRASIARAFLHDPTLLVLDEPTAALDVIGSQFLADAVREKRRAGKGVLFSTHVMSEAESLCDRVVFLHQGAVAQQGEIGALLSRGDGDLKRAFLECVGR
jgi:sodium transport system ATP-binding protein